MRSNTISSLIVVNSQRFLTYTSCQTFDYANCLKFVGNNWEAIRRAYYDTPTFNTVSCVTLSGPLTSLFSIVR